MLFYQEMIQDNRLQFANTFCEWVAKYRDGSITQNEETASNELVRELDAEIAKDNLEEIGNQLKRVVDMYLDLGVYFGLEKAVVEALELYERNRMVLGDVAQYINYCLERIKGEALMCDKGSEYLI